MRKLDWNWDQLIVQSLLSCVTDQIDEDYKVECIMPISEGARQP